MNLINYTIAVMIYNVERFLPECLDSIVAQQGNDIEIILIDDGATDSSGAICDSYAAKDGRIRVIHQKNAGVSAARNTALDNAKGKWLIQVDGDDILTEHAIDSCRPYLDDDSAWLQFDAVTFYDINKLPNWTPKGEKLIVSGDLLRILHVQLIDRSGTEVVFPTYNMNPAWSKAWNMAFLRKYNMHYDTDVVKGEGTLFTFNCSYYAQKVTFVPSLMYGYRINPSSIMHRFSANILDGQNIQMETYQKIIAEHKENNDEVVQLALRKRGLYLIENAIRLGVAHPDCTFNKNEKRLFLGRLCDLFWARDAANFKVVENGKIEPYFSIIHWDISNLLRYCDRIRRKTKIIRTIECTRIGQSVLKNSYKKMKK